SLEEIQRWPLREYLASGGHPMWFRSHVRSLMNQHLRRLNHTTLGKMRLPIPGGRHYVMPAAVGRRAGLQGLDVPRGHVQIDDRRATAWVNDDDWLALPDSPKGEGIAAILGGADNDDALWLFPFTDQAETSPDAAAGERKVLAWRSPNQVGEYVLLKPTADSHPLPWVMAAGEALTYPDADSRQLPPRIDSTDPAYLGLVDADSAGDLGEGLDYNVVVMEAAIERAIANQGALGMYCNSLMLNKALYGCLPALPPAPLEDIIDSAVKTGADLSQVVAWNYANSREILTGGTPIPALLHQRLSIDRTDRENRPPRPRTSGFGSNPEHWLDRLERGIQAHIQHIQDERERLAALARPPEAVLQIAEDHPDWVRLGAGLNQAYAAALKSGQTGRFATVLDWARWVAEDYLAHFRPEQRGNILLGALASVYGREREGSDKVAWLAGGSSGDGRRGPGTASDTILALRELAMLNELV
ncbi:MAG: hypothetical protein KDE04_24750, partial [Anaerolineales bacterium]|nr:hypothetical protein [Anaerolineales bacterium]